ncbi:MAG: DUF4783 domain-containing protein [Bacteroidales bacterium]|nr:DUF4783 domain-containing protein [Bacteroidales bacterium]
MKKYIISLFILASNTLTVFCGDVPQGIISAFYTGNSSKLSEYFNQTIELTLFDKEEIYSKTQAEIIMRDFFTQNKPTQFKIIHQGGKEHTSYAIGNLICASKKFRVTLLLKTENSSVYIHQLRIEKDYAE